MKTFAQGHHSHDDLEGIQATLPREKAESGQEAKEDRVEGKSNTTLHNGLSVKGHGCVDASIGTVESRNELIDNDPEGMEY